MNRSQHIVQLFCDGHSIEKIAINEFVFGGHARVDEERIEDIIRKALKIHGRAENKKRKRDGGGKKAVLRKVVLASPRRMPAGKRNEVAGDISPKVQADARGIQA